MAKRARTRSSSNAPTATRTIHFYRADLGVDANQVPVQCRWDLVQRQLLAANVAARLVSGPPDVLGGARRAAGEFWVAGIRRDNFPLVETGGQLTDLTLPDGTGLAEVVHVRCFPDNILGVVFNFYGPRVSAIARYFGTICPNYCKAIRFQPLLRQDAVERIRRMSDVKLFTMRVYSSYVDEVAQLDKGLGASLKAAFEFSNGLEVEIVARPRLGKATLSQSVTSFAARLLRRSDARDGVSKLKVRGYVEGGLETVDGLADEFLIRREIELTSERSRALRDDKAFEAIGQAYSDLKDALVAAPSLEYANAE